MNAVMKYPTMAAMLCMVASVTLSVMSCSTKATQPADSVDVEKLDEAFLLAGQLGNLKSLVVSQHGTVVRGAFYRDGGADVPHDTRSVTKSVVGLLIGIAIDKGFILSVDQTIGTYLRPLVDTLSPEKAAITIRHLLTMTSGFEWDELTSVTGYNDWIASPNQVQFLLNKPLVAQPGIAFTYNSAALHLLSVILTRATGMSTLEFATTHLFAPLGIGVSGWSTDKQGYYNGGASLKLTPYDMITIGRLVLDGGQWNGTRIVSAQWIAQMISSKISTQNVMPFTNGYGYCWWTGQCTQGTYAFANGYGGQFIVVVPSLDVVVVATNTWSGIASNVANDQWYRTMDVIVNRVLPAFR